MQNSWFTLDEMLGKPRNLVRHSDIPKRLADLALKMVNRMGPVKNRLKMVIIIGLMPL